MEKSSINPKSDVDAKAAFIQELIRRGFEEARVTSSPSDVTARRDGVDYYFEIKYTTKDSQYFGAATLTEWEAAIKFEDRYSFVVAARRNGAWIFHEYSPAEFMAFSYVPPFKVFFNIAVGADKAVSTSKVGKTVRLSRERLAQMGALFNSFRSK